MTSLFALLTLTVTLANPAVPVFAGVPIINGVQIVTDQNVGVPLEAPVGPGVLRCDDLVKQLSRNPLAKAAVCQ